VKDPRRTTLLPPKAGADKIAINSAAVRDPALIGRIAGRFGSQAVVVAIDTRKVDGGFEVFVAGGRVPTGRDAVQWAREAAACGAGEILLTSMDRDGTQSGFDCQLVHAVAEAVSIPVIASGGLDRRATSSRSFAKAALTRLWLRPSFISASRISHN
jgi:imidazole glycerol-phosphate synthase subunit HisF